MPLQLVDTHCHLDRQPLSVDVPAVLARARAAGVVACLTIGTDLASSRAAVALARAHPGVRCAIGVHPNDAAEATEEALRELEALAEDPAVAAIGEVGLDYYRQGAPADVQERIFLRFAALARRRGLPLSIHCRNAHEPLLALLRAQGGPVRGVLHCASGPAGFLQDALALGLHVSFAGNVTFPNAVALRALVPLVPEERLLLETDAPFLAPQPVRGQSNEPAHVVHTAHEVARLRGVSVEALGEAVTRNACALFAFTRAFG